MRYSDLTPEGKRIIAGMETALVKAPDIYLSTVAVLLSITGKTAEQLICGYSRNEYKRAIKCLREGQKMLPEYAADYEKAILLIRREWLHRER